jgi:hypothetical protein
MNPPRGKDHIPSRNSDNQIHHHQQDALQPVGLAISNEVVDQKDRHEQCDDLEAIKVEGLSYLSVIESTCEMDGLSLTISSTPMIHPRTTISGRTNNAICILEPTATPIARSILSLQATVTAVACSAALPTIGRRINPTNVSPMLPVAVNASMEET